MSVEPATADLPQSVPVSLLSIKPKRRRIQAVALVVVVGSLCGLVLSSARHVLKRTVPVHVVPVVLAPLTARHAEDAASTEVQALESGLTVQAPGWIEAYPFYIACAALADGIVAEVLVLEGDRVRAGDVVAKLVDTDARLALERAKAEHASAGAAIHAADAELRFAQTNWDNPVEQNRAVSSARGERDAKLAELNQLPALVAMERATYDKMHDELQRFESALGASAMNDIEVVVLRKEVEAQGAAVLAAEQREHILKAELDVLSSELHAAEENLRLRVQDRRVLAVATSELARAKSVLAETAVRVEESQLRFDRMTVVSPIDGFVQRRLKVPGDKVIQGMDDPHSAHLVHLYDPELIQVRVDVPLADAAHVSVGQACELIADILPETTFSGEVTRITHESDLQKNTLQVKVRVIDPSPLLKPETLTRVKFLPLGRNKAEADEQKFGRSSEDPVLISASCIELNTQGHGLVRVVRQRRDRTGVVALVSVTVLQTEGPFSTVQGDIRVGDLVVVEGSHISDGTFVNILGDTVGGGAS